MYRPDELKAVLGKLPNVHTLEVECQSDATMRWKILVAVQAALEHMPHLTGVLIIQKFGEMLSEMEENLFRRFLDSWNHRQIEIEFTDCWKQYHKSDFAQ